MAMGMTVGVAQIRRYVFGVIRIILSGGVYWSVVLMLVTKAPVAALAAVAGKSRTHSPTSNHGHYSLA